MSARKLGRFAGLVFVLAALVGGTGAATASAGHGTGGSSTVKNVSATKSGLIDVIWG
jgi:hypothetical protein